ncbi:MAG: hypothetical protein Q8L55_13145 [Phycisphaerales bacterium]|nr:hypothetical protein [Phycisphaerales bacterium]
MRIEPSAMFSACIVMVVLTGCVSEPPLPTYLPMSDAAALTAIADRQASVTSIWAECDLELTDAQGQSVSLDGVLIAVPPGKVRLRAWKFGHAVFDLTLRDGQGWVFVPDEGPTAGKMSVESTPAQRVGEALELLGPSYFRTARPAGGDKTTLIAEGTAMGRDNVECEIDRLTLTPRRFVLGAAGGGSSSELRLERYRLVGDVVWPTRLRLRSPSGEVVATLREVELGGDVPAGAFTPPQRAKALP